MSLLKADTIKPVTSSGDLSLQGDSGGSAVDCLNITSAGDINFTGNTDAKIKLPSGGGIYESDGTTPVLTESGGVATLGSAVVVSGVTGSIVKVHGPYAYSDIVGITVDGALSGVTQALTVGTGNDIIVVPDIIVRRTGSATSQYSNVYINGGSLGATTSGYNFTSAAGYQVYDNVNQHYTIHKLDTSPTTSPTYTMYADVVGGTWSFLNIQFTFFEIQG